MPLPPGSDAGAIASGANWMRTESGAPGPTATGALAQSRTRTLVTVNGAEPVGPGRGDVHREHLPAGHGAAGIAEHGRVGRVGAAAVVHDLQQRVGERIEPRAQVHRCRPACAGVRRAMRAGLRWNVTLTRRTGVVSVRV